MLLSWNDFKNNSKNPTSDFEDLCRLFFKIYYLKDVYYNLSQTTNNPGIETEPVYIDGERVGFQAKYFPKNVAYSQILHSAKETVKYYPKKIDKVIIFCNQNINDKAEDFVEAKRVLAEQNIAVELCCNKSILDIISIGTEYGAIRNLFFGKLNLTDEWFNNTLTRSLDELNPRYESGFHVDEYDIQRHFDLLYRSDDVKKYISEIINNAKKSLQQVTEYRHIANSIKQVVDKFIVPESDNYELVLAWYDEFEPIIQAISQEQEIVQKSLDECYVNKEKKSNEEWNRLYYKQRQINELDSIVSEFNFSENEYFRFLNNNILVVEGDAGQGKSHLLGYEAESHSINGESRTILLLGQKFIFTKAPQEQIVQMLELKASFQEFVTACELKGSMDGKLTVIMIDAINECYDQRIWKQYLNNIIEEIKKLKYVKFVCSIRTTYKEYVFSDKIHKDIENGNISLIRVFGFKNNLSEAIPYFFNYYKIPVTTAAFFNFEFENPLFLHTYCAAYKNGANVNSKNIFALYEAYSKAEEKKIREINNITDGISYTNLIINAIGEYMFRNGKNCIPEPDLYAKLSLYPNAHIILDGLIRAKVLLAYFYDEQRIIYINYEQFTDFLIARHILESFDDYDTLSSWIISDMLKVDEYGRFSGHYVEGHFSALSVLVREKYHKEIINCITSIKGFSHYTHNQAILEYINAMNYRADADINEKDYYDYVVPNIQTKGAVEKHIELLIGLSGRSCSLNMNSTTNWLMSLPINKRDHIWTLHINSHYSEGERIFYTVQYFLYGNLDYILPEEKVLFGQLLIWFFTASNRELRDKSSKALIRHLKNDISSMIQLLNIFSGVNDPYVISRLYGCVYGALLQTKNINNSEAKELCQFIYQSVFHQDIIYPDILLRDYARNIIEYCQHINVDLCFSIEECRPPYKSFDIPKIDVKQLNNLYPKFVKGKTFGTYAIKTSLAPEYGIKDFVSMYGDFGRYTFQSALRYFKDVDFENIFSYAYWYIIKKLNYNNDEFSEYDQSMGVGRGRKFGHIERIGKKYEWIAMYHILALVSDRNYLDTNYFSVSKEYHGAWHPCVRDFDPTAQIENSNRVHEIDTLITRSEYTNWNLRDDNWFKIDDTGSFKENIRLMDSNGEPWVALCFSISDATNQDYEKPRQSVWLSLTACLIKKSEFDGFIDNVKRNKLYGRRLNVRELSGNDSVFMREYPWAPAFFDDDGENNIDVEIEEKRIIKKKKVSVLTLNGIPIEQVSNETLYDPSGVLSLEETEQERDYYEPIMKHIGTLTRCNYYYLWDHRQDCSNSDSVGVRLPASYIVGQLGLKQTMDGVWENNTEIVCVDFKLVKGSNVDGLYIKEKYLQQLLNNGMTIVWVGMGEKQHLYGSIKNDAQSWSDIDSVIYIDNDGNFVELQSVEHSGYNSDNE